MNSIIQRARIQLGCKPTQPIEHIIPSWERQGHGARVLFSHYSFFFRAVSFGGTTVRVRSITHHLEERKGVSARTAPGKLQVKNTRSGCGHPQHLPCACKAHAYQHTQRMRTKRVMADRRGRAEESGHVSTVCTGLVIFDQIPFNPTRLDRQLNHAHRSLTYIEPCPVSLQISNN